MTEKNSIRDATIKTLMKVRNLSYNDAIKEYERIGSIPMEDEYFKFFDMLLPHLDDIKTIEDWNKIFIGTKHEIKPLT